MDCAWVSSGSRSMWQNRTPHCARHSGLDTPWNFWGAMTPQYCRTGLVGPVTKGRWWLSWTNRRYGRNLVSLIWTKLEAAIKWMEASWFSSCKESAFYTVYCEGGFHCGVWHWWGNTIDHVVPPRQTVNTACYCTFLLHHIRPGLGKRRPLVIQNPIILHENARIYIVAAVTELLRLCQWKILEHRS